MELTSRQKEVLSLLIKGYSNQSIADCLNLRPKTIKWYLTDIFISHGVKNRSQLIIKLLGKLPEPVKIKLTAPEVTEYIYSCCCKSSDEGTLKETKVNEDKICLACGHYAVLQLKNQVRAKILQLFKKGFKQKEIARVVGIKTGTVRYHLLRTNTVKKGVCSDVGQRGQL